MTFAQILSKLAADVTRGVHLSPLLHLLVNLAGTTNGDSFFAQLASTDVHQFVAVVVLAETVASFLEHKSD